MMNKNRVSFALYMEIQNKYIRELNKWGTWVARSVKYLTPDDGLGHDLRVVR